MDKNIVPSKKNVDVMMHYFFFLHGFTKAQNFIASEFINILTHQNENKDVEPVKDFPDYFQWFLT